MTQRMQIMTKLVPTHVLINEIMWPWKDKAPYVPSGYSVHGAVEYHAPTKRFKCHECGEWVTSMGNHLRVRHRNVREHREMRCRDLKIAHGISLKNAILRPDQIDEKRAQAFELRAANKRFDIAGRLPSRPGTAYSRVAKLRRAYRAKSVLPTFSHSENTNERSACWRQRGAILKEWAKQLGRTPTRREADVFIYVDSYGLQSKPLNSGALIHAFGAGAWKRLLLENGLTPRTPGYGGHLRKGETR